MLAALLHMVPTALHTNAKAAFYKCPASTIHARMAAASSEVARPPDAAMRAATADAATTTPAGGSGASGHGAAAAGPGKDAPLSAFIAGALAPARNVDQRQLQQQADMPPHGADSSSVLTSHALVQGAQSCMRMIDALAAGLGADAAAAAAATTTPVPPSGASSSGGGGSALPAQQLAPQHAVRLLLYGTLHITEEQAICGEASPLFWVGSKSCRKLLRALAGDTTSALLASVLLYMPLPTLLPLRLLLDPKTWLQIVRARPVVRAQYDALLATLPSAVAGGGAVDATLQTFLQQFIDSPQLLRLLAVATLRLACQQLDGTPTAQQAQQRLRYSKAAAAALQQQVAQKAQGTFNPSAAQQQELRELERHVAAIASDAACQRHAQVSVQLDREVRVAGGIIRMMLSSGGSMQLPPEERCAQCMHLAQRIGNVLQAGITLQGLVREAAMAKEAVVSSGGAAWPAQEVTANVMAMLRCCCGPGCLGIFLLDVFRHSSAGLWDGLWGLAVHWACALEPSQRLTSLSLAVAAQLRFSPHVWRDAKQQDTLWAWLEAFTGPHMAAKRGIAGLMTATAYHPQLIGRDIFLEGGDYTVRCMQHLLESAHLCIACACKCATDVTAHRAPS